MQNKKILDRARSSSDGLCGSCGCGQALSYEQTIQTNAFRDGVKNRGSKFVNSPIQFE